MTYNDVPDDEPGPPPKQFASTAAAAADAISMRQRRTEEDAHNELLEVCARNPSLVLRAKEMFRGQMVDLPHVKIKGNGPTAVTEYLNKDQNRAVIIKAVTADSPPYLDTFMGRAVDHTGTPIDKRLPIGEWFETFTAFGLRHAQSPSAAEIRATLSEVANHTVKNSLTERLAKLMPDWDGVPRMEAFLIVFFKCHDTPLARQFSRYFWLSFYGRMMMPGLNAPISLALIGAQNCGKSYFQKRLVQIVLGNDNADVVQLDISAKDFNGFLRAITGRSIIASVGEMTGWQTSDVNKVKSFQTTTVDTYDNKFQDPIQQARQWIPMFDANKYEGFQRDDTGNRRMWPCFCGQSTDKDGKPQWDAAFRVSDEDWKTFESNVWQMFAEAAAWFREHSMEDYHAFINDVTKGVSDFSADEMASGRGTIAADDVLESAIDAAIRDSDVRSTKGPNGPVAYIDKLAFANTLMELTPGFKSQPGRVIMKRLMAQRGAIESTRKDPAGFDDKGRKIYAQVHVWKFDGCGSLQDILRMMMDRRAVHDPDFAKDDGDEAVTKQDGF